MPALAIALASKARNYPDIIKLENFKEKDRYKNNKNLIFKGTYCIKIKEIIKRKYDSLRN